MRLYGSYLATTTTHRCESPMVVVISIITKVGKWYKFSTFPKYSRHKVIRVKERRGYKF